jgi:flavin reductase (DIM6/NTAB) family NADH-FMN oxidoreductase RutF
MFTNGITVVLTGTEIEYSGMTISWITMIETDHLVMSLPKNTKATTQLLENKIFSVSELTEGQEDIAKQFDGKKCNMDNLVDKSSIKYDQSGLPIIFNCCSNAICDVIFTHEVNQQILIAGKITKVMANNELKPLIYNKSDYFSDSAP